jgi:hypothetical protein
VVLPSPASPLSRSSTPSPLTTSGSLAVRSFSFFDCSRSNRLSLPLASIALPPSRRQCSPLTGNFVHIFEKIGAETGLPPILLASFALQESTCNPNVVGGGGEVGLMQFVAVPFPLLVAVLITFLFRITPDKCNGMGTSACKDPATNVRTAPICR